MLPRKLLLYFIAVTVLIPTTVAAGLMGLLATLFGLATLVERNFAASFGMFGLVLPGAAGIVSMWCLFFYLRKDLLPERRAPYFISLVLGLMVSVATIGLFADSLLYYAMFGWPLIGAAYFLITLFLHQKVDR